jgi:hypothetical protein
MHSIESALRNFDFSLGCRCTVQSFVAKLGRGSDAKLGRSSDTQLPVGRKRPETSETPQCTEEPPC